MMWRTIALLVLIAVLGTRTTLPGDFGKKPDGENTSFFSPSTRRILFEAAVGAGVAMAFTPILLLLAVGSAGCKAAFIDVVIVVAPFACAGAGFGAAFEYFFQAVDSLFVFRAWATAKGIISGATGLLKAGGKWLREDSVGAAKRATVGAGAAVKGAASETADLVRRLKDSEGAQRAMNDTVTALKGAGAAAKAAASGTADLLKATAKQLKESEGLKRAVDGVGAAAKGGMQAAAKGAAKVGEAAKRVLTDEELRAAAKRVANGTSQAVRQAGARAVQGLGRWMRKE
ncbi:hypothetical protein PAPYR_5092 [Paratrimastix pyriformis]|uniref:Uncharacterized protein n=1 Tax=Paratrimastix pyriformis TaxID=342808 RepID=A0ABQ8UII7_9EUKA|nr:hypothetical protein PAPYR_5092 [Paratrimastix pyriformis]